MRRWEDLNVHRIEQELGLGQGVYLTTSPITM